MYKYLIIILLLTYISSFSQQVKMGSDILFTDSVSILDNKSIGIISNHTGILSDGRHIIDALVDYEKAELKAIFGPEHGIKGNAPDGASITDDKLNNVPVYSLYGKFRKPTSKMLEGIDLLIFDIQDIGARYYTYISTLYNCIEASAEFDIPIIVLDRPNPIGGLRVDGPLIEDEFKSFVATAKIPIVHGLTIAELAIFFNDEFIGNSSFGKADLKVIKMLNWERDYFYSDCGLKWIKPSPNIPDLKTAVLYPGLCLIEGTNISEGRGTYKPFKQIGAPYINSTKLLNEIKLLDYESIDIDTVSFRPQSIDTMSKYPKYKDELCFGIKIIVNDMKNFESLRFGIELIAIIKKLHPEKFKFRKNWIDKLYGSEKLKYALENSLNPLTLYDSWEKDLNSFRNIRKKYLLY
jgi:uncharacterized protein YbbC (DUF1343 family)